MKQQHLKESLISSMLRKVKLPFFKDENFKYRQSIIDGFSAAEKEEMGEIMNKPVFFKYVEVYKQFMADCCLRETNINEKMGFTYGDKHITSMINLANESFCPERQKEKEEKKS